MKKDTTYKIRLGIFITLGILVFITGIYFIGQRQQLFRSTFRITGIFTDVAGLQAGSNVRLSGINVGTVEVINIVSDTTVKVEMLIDDNTRKFIKKDAFISIGSDGLMGNKVLVINPGTGGKPEIENNDYIKTVQPMDMDDIMLSLKNTIDNTSNITKDLSVITNTIQSGRGTVGRLLIDSTLAINLDSSIVNLNQSLAGLNRLVNGAQVSFAQNFDSTFINLKKGSAGFNELMDKAKSSWLLWGF